MKSVSLQSLMKKVMCPKNCKVRLEMNEVKLNPDLQVVCRSKTKVLLNYYELISVIKLGFNILGFLKLILITYFAKFPTNYLKKL